MFNHNFLKLRVKTELTPHVGHEMGKRICTVIHSGRVGAILHRVVNAADCAGISDVIDVTNARVFKEFACP